MPNTSTIRLNSVLSLVPGELKSIMTRYFSIF